MKTTEHDVIDLKTAIDAKKLGFNLPCKYAYDKCDILCTDLPSGKEAINYNTSGYLHSAPFKDDYEKWRIENNITGFKIRDIDDYYGIV